MDKAKTYEARLTADEVKQMQKRVSFFDEELSQAETLRVLEDLLTYIEEEEE